MRVNLNKKKQAQCPGCGKWNDLEIEQKHGIYHEFTCCGRYFIVNMDEENLERLSKGEKLKDIPFDWWKQI